MAHPKTESEIYPLETVVRLKRTHEFAIIKDRVFQYNGPGGFLHYRGIIEDRGDGLYALFHDDLDLECLPPS